MTEKQIDPVLEEISRQAVGAWLKEFLSKQKQKADPGRPLVYVVKADVLVGALKKESTK